MAENTVKTFTRAEALIEANRCLYCFEPSCQKGCPAGIDVRRFIRRIATEDFEGARQTICKDNPLGAVCGFVCPSEQLCKKECASKALNRPIQISELQAYVMTEGAPPAPTTGKPTGKKVAVVGGGPSGIAAAVILAKAGHAVTIFEKDGQLGGIPKTQIPGFRLTAQVIDGEVKGLLNDGIEVRLSTPVDKAMAGQLVADYDAVYLAAGLGEMTCAVDMAGADCYFAEDFLESYNAGRIKAADIGDDVVVIGGGNTAMDAASAAKALGAANVSVLYRRTQTEMPAWEREYLHAVGAGVAFSWHTQVIDVEATNGKVTAVKAAATVPSGKDADGRDIMKADADNAYKVKASCLISALGRGANAAIADAFGLATDAKGRVKVDEDGYAGGKVYAGGDLTNGGATVVQAVADAKRAAAAINAKLTG